MEKKQPLLPSRVITALVIIMGLALACGVAAKKDTAIETRTETSYSFLPFASAVEPAFSLSPVGEGFNFVTAITNAGDDRIFVAELAGVIKVLQPDGHASVFLDISDQVTTNGSEYGFYHLIFHPGYHDPGSPGYGAFYVSYSRGPEDAQPSDVDLVFSKFRVSADPDVADPASEAYIMVIEQTKPHHKGGSMAFDPRDDSLYLGVGDDQTAVNAQRDDTPKGKILRLNVDGVPPHATGDVESYVTSEIWASGLRNPWKISLDVPSNRLFIGDVGEVTWEEVNLLPLSARGTNFGWPCQEGLLMDPLQLNLAECVGLPYTPPIHTYSHVDGSGRCSVIAGFVNRPYFNPDDGRFIFGDLCSREVFALTESGGDWQRSLLGIREGNIFTTIGEDARGIQYLGTLDQPGPIYALFIP